MPLVPIQAVPGISKAMSDYASGKAFGFGQGRSLSGRYSDANHVRFVAGFPEKIGGWLQINGITGVIGIPRAAKSWRDNNANPRVGFGTESHLYSWDGATLLDITPKRSISTGTLGTNPLTTSSGSPVVAVADTTAHLVNGDWVLLQGATAVNGITVNGWYAISSFVQGTGYNITTTQTASGNGAGGGSAVTFSYPRRLLGSNPFTTTNGSATVTVADNNHGAQTGDYVTYSGASAFNNVTINGQYPLTVVNANSYTIQASTQANAGSSGGGSAVQVQYNITQGALTITNPVNYNVGAYNTGPFGYSQSSVATSATGWTLDRYGNQLLACPIGGTIYVYDTLQGGVAHALLNAPNDILAMFVTAERFVVALGNATSSMQLSWADQSDYTNWTTLITDTANSGRTLQGGTKFITGAPVRDGVSLAWSDKAVFQFNYSGDNLVYDTPEASDNASILSPWSFAVLGEAAYWMGNGDFWMWNGTIQSLPSDDIRDFVYKNINPLYLQKCWAMPVRSKQEIWFCYPSMGASEVDSYVIFHILEQCWSIGTWTGLLGSAARTAGIDQDLFSNPIMFDVNGAAYQHEVGTDDNGQPLLATLTFAPIDVSNGDANVDVMGFMPDFSYLAQSVSLTVNTRLYPQDANSVNGPYTLTPNDTNPYQDLRDDGKMVGFEFTSNVLGGDFRVGTPRLNIQPAGARI